MSIDIWIFNSEVKMAGRIQAGVAIKDLESDRPLCR